MAKLTKKQKVAVKKVDPNKVYSLEQASKLVKEVNYANFNASVDIAIRLGVDPKKANQMVRGTVALPHGTGRSLRVLALVAPDKEQAATEAGADFVGLDEYLKKIEGGWTDIDVIITTPDVMPKLGKLGRVLGPRGLMPNPKAGTVTTDISKAVKEVKAGKIDFKVDKFGIIHASIGRVNFTPEQINANAAEIIHTVARLKPTSAKGTYFKSVTISSTMSPGIAIDAHSVAGI